MVTISMGDEDVSYISVKQAIEELRQATHTARMSQRARVRLPPVVCNAEQKLVRPMTTRSITGFPTSGERVQNSMISLSSTTAASSPARRTPRDMALGGSVKSGLNSPSTHVYNSQPLKPIPGPTGFEAVGSYSMFGSQAKSDRMSSAAFGFGTTTRDQLQRLYISPGHLKIRLGTMTPGPVYALQSSLGRQVLDSKMSYPSAKFLCEERFEADKRELYHRMTPGPGAYRV